MLLLCALVVGNVSVWAAEVNFDFSFTSIGSTGWSNSYAAHSVSFDEATVTFSSASKQTGTITTVPVTKGQPVELVMKDGKTLNSVKFVCKQWGSKAQTITLHYSTDGGDNYTTTEVSSTNFTITGSDLPSGTNAVKITFSSTSNQVGIVSATIDYSNPAPAHTVTAISNNDELGTVSIDGSIITASPNSGNRVISGEGGYTVTSGTASVTNNGDNTFIVTPSSDCTVQINFEAIPNHSVIGVASPVAGGSVEAADASVREGETTTLTATPNAGYKFTGWAVTGTGASLSSTSDNPTTLTIGTSDATVTASFEVATTYPIHWSVNGVIVKTDNVVENSPVTFAAPESGVPAGYVFKGWVVEANKIDTPTDSDPSANYVTSANGTAEITYYAVLAHEIDNTTKEKVTITIETENVPTSYGNANTFTEYSLDGVKFKVQQMYINSNRLQWRAAGNSNGTGTMYNTEALSNIQSIVLTYYGDDNKNFTVKVGDAENPTSGTSVEPSASGDVYTFDCSSLGKSYFVMTNGSGAGYLASVVINYLGGEIITFGYCTTVPPATYTRPVTADKWGTLCLPYDATVTGATLYTFKGVDDTDAPTVAYFEEAASVEAGKPYFFKAKGETLTATYTSAEAQAASSANGAVGTLTDIDVAEGKYLLSDNKLVKCGTGCTLAANRVYVDMTAVSVYSGGGAVKMGVDLTDGISVVDAQSANATVFDLSGRRVVKPTKGLYIVNGKKVVK